MHRVSLARAAGPLRTGLLAFVTFLTLPLSAAAGGPAAHPPAADTTGPGRFEKVVLVEDTTDPVELSVAPDGRVFFIERGGPIRVWDPKTDSTYLAGFIPVSTLEEDGMLGLTLDPDFARNGWLYVYYSPAGPEAKNELARFTVRGNEIDPATRKVLLEIPTQRDYCCHTGGSLAFGPDGNLFLSTGDNTNPNDSQLYSPIDERPGFAKWDAQRTSGNTNDLRGKILRIRPMPDGSYEIPEGNLFPGGKDGRPEIFTMGYRNPYRISIDQKTGCVYSSEVGPGADAPNENRGPAGGDEFNRACEPGFYGWPYFVGNNEPYREYDFGTGVSGDYFDPARPVNDSPNNTGARILPPAKPALIFYPHSFSEQYPMFGAGGQTAMSGPIYHYDAETVGPHGLPARYDGSWFIYEWMRNWVMEVRFEEGGEVAEIKPFLEDLFFMRPTDMELGPDGSLYLIEWGAAFWGNNEDAQIVRVLYHDPARPAPVAQRPAQRPAANPAAPKVEITWPPAGGVFDYGAPIAYHALVTSPQGERVPDAGVTVQPWMVRDTYPKALTPAQGREGTFRIETDTLYETRARQVGRLEVRAGRGDDAGRAVVTLQPRRQQAEFANVFEGVQRKTTGDFLKKINVRTFVVGRDGGYLAVEPVNLHGIDGLTFRVKPLAGGTIEVRLGAPDGRRLGAVTVDPAGAGRRTMPAEPVPATHDLAEVKRDNSQDPEAEGWLDVRVPVRNPGGTHTLYLVFRGPAEADLLQLDWFEFNGPGIRK